MYLHHWHRGRTVTHGGIHVVPLFPPSRFYDRPTRSALPSAARARADRKDTLIKFDLGLSRQVSPPGPRSRRRSQYAGAIKLVFQIHTLPQQNKRERHLGIPRFNETWPPSKSVMSVRILAESLLLRSYPRSRGITADVHIQFLGQKIIRVGLNKFATNDRNTCS